MEALTANEQEAFREVVSAIAEPAYLEALCRLLMAGKSPRRILDALQIASAQVMLETQDSQQLLAAAALLRILNTLAGTSTTSSTRSA